MDLKVPDYSGHVNEYVPTGDDLNSLGHLIHQMLSMETQVDHAEEHLKNRKEHLRKLSQQEIPDLMRKIRIKEFTTEDGFHVRVDDDVRAIPKAENKPYVYQWLEDNGHGGLIQTNVSIQFPRMYAEQAQELMTELEIRFPGNVGQDMKVHSQTLKKFVKDELKAGRSIPMDMFGAYPFSKTKITKKNT